MSIKQKVELYIKENNLLPPNAKIILGVSGGSDSVAMLDILHNLGYECIVAHCNFHLRGEESYRDEYFVEKLAAKYGLQFIFTHFDTKKYVQNGAMSIEMAARELRYAWFEKIRKENNADFVAVAHHMDDSVETVLLNLIRGTGVRGLSGISNKNGNIVRPLLGISHSEVLTYLKEKELTFVLDSTNQEEVYTRNKIRLSVIPLLETINPSVKQAINRTAENIQQVEKIYLAYADKAKRKIFVDNRINIPLLLQLAEPKTILFEILFPFGFNPATVENIYDSIEAQSGKIFYSDMYRLIKDRECFILEEYDFTSASEGKSHIINKNDGQITEPFSMTFEIMASQSDFEFEKTTQIAYFDYQKILFPLTLRKWQHGDWFIPFGMQGKKKLSDYFTNKKYSIIDKENVWLLCSGRRIIWIVGDRADNRFRITDETKKILKISITQPIIGVE